MPNHPTPTAEGHYWAKLVHPHQMPEGEYWASPDWEVVRVCDNNGEGADKWRVAMHGIEPFQLIESCIWGPQVPEYRP